VEHARSAKELRLLRRIEGVGKWVDVREYLRRIDATDPDATQTVHDAGLVGDFVAIGVDLEIRGSGAIKISEVAEALAGAGNSEPLEHRAVRVAIGTWKDGVIASPLDLPAVRKGLVVTAPAAAAPDLEASPS
jgi:hypothetical protein